MSQYLDCDVNVAAGSIIEPKKSQNFGGDCHDNSMPVQLNALSW
jgi:hypothetical protein